MKVTLTSLELKGPLKFFALSYKAMKIMKQLRGTNCVQTKTRGIWTKHYTMSLWNSDKELRDFSVTGAHLQAMKKSGEIAREIRTYTYDAETLPDWKTAKDLLIKRGRVIRYNRPDSQGN